MRRLPSWQRYGVVSQQRLWLRRFDSRVKRFTDSKLVSFLFLICFSIVLRHVLAIVGCSNPCNVYLHKGLSLSPVLVHYPSIILTTRRYSRNCKSIRLMHFLYNISKTRPLKLFFKITIHPHHMHVVKPRYPLVINFIFYKLKKPQKH